MGQIVKLPGMADPETLRHTLRDTNAPELLLRRAIIGASLVGMASMAIIALFQGGFIKHLPDPPIKGFDSDKVNSSDTAYGWGMPRFADQPHLTRSEYRTRHLWRRRSCTNPAARPARGERRGCTGRRHVGGLSLLRNAGRRKRMVPVLHRRCADAYRRLGIYRVGIEECDAAPAAGVKGRR